MKRRGINLTIFLLAIMILFLQCLAFMQSINAEPMDLEGIKKYDFDEPIEQTTVGSTAKSAFTLVVYLSIFIAVCVLALFTTRWLAKYRKNFNLKSKYMEVIDNLPLGNDKGIYIIRAPQGLLMIGVSSKGVYILDRLDSSQADLINEAESRFISTNKFAGHLESIMKKIKNTGGHSKDGDLS